MESSLCAAEYLWCIDLSLVFYRSAYEEQSSTLSSSKESIKRLEEVRIVAVGARVIHGARNLGSIKVC